MSPFFFSTHKTFFLNTHLSKKFKSIVLKLLVRNTFKIRNVSFVAQIKKIAKVCTLKKKSLLNQQNWSVAWCHSRMLPIKHNT